jgi:hypothetical protein
MSRNSRNRPGTPPRPTLHLQRIGMLAALALFALSGNAAELRGQFDAGFASGGSEPSWLEGGLGKSFSDGSSLSGRATLRGETELFNDLVGAIVLDASSERDVVVQLQEAWLGWNPVPQGSWRTRIKAGAFFPVTSLEVGYDGVGWGPERTLSSSAINSWISEEIRIVGIELALLHRGVFVGSPHSFGATVAAFGGNDPAGTLLAWRGWTVGRHVTGLGEHLMLADLPVYRPGGPLAAQQREIHVFREIDHRAGYYGTLTYGYSDWLEAALMHYDNRGDPLAFESGQYSWHTRFDHISMQLRTPGQWEFLAQGMQGETLMGPSAVKLRYASWYVLASHPLGAGLLTLRHDRFRARDLDGWRNDPNEESGNAWALAWKRPLSDSLNLVTEVQVVDSERPARTLTGAAPLQIDRVVGIELRWVF